MEAFGYETLEKSLSLIAHYLRPHCIADSAIKYVLPEEDSKIPSYASLPLDVLLRVMELVDSKTYDTFSLVCKSLRKEWFLHPRVSDYRINAAETFEMEICNYLPRARLHGFRADGTATSLLIFYPVHRFHDDDDCKNRIKCRYNSCCSCPHLCIEKKCPKPLQLQAPLESKGIYRIDETRTERQDGESLYWEYIWSWEEYMPGLVLMDPNNVCEICARRFDVENL
ncbi:uncharacterized protein FOMMEDRAFT_22328 [Fomitiporia mediterranea MF3/22]|uniref:uncharacterized protein n=1 Tax=Fomitiporia mediterranea (strain MF3/22) TaxID=694068 RepID=UPI0004408216|nr:uncharacterized protein FOMMEDRAFT_22328 [Fomitiporia mediterranea MF3/22]EJD00559.1 hypothetical protein FOMMEDRAFT_22328 [Fomitiporia mediterranea MF3/22]